MKFCFFFNQGVNELLYISNNWMILICEKMEAAYWDIVNSYHQNEVSFSSIFQTNILLKANWMHIPIAHKIPYWPVLSQVTILPLLSHLQPFDSACLISGTPLPLLIKALRSASVVFTTIDRVILPLFSPLLIMCYSFTEAHWGRIQYLDQIRALDSWWAIVLARY